MGRSDESFEKELAKYKRKFERLDREIRKMKESFAEDEERRRTSAQFAVGGWVIGAAPDSWRSVDYVALRRAIHELVLRGDFTTDRVDCDVAMKRLAAAEKMVLNKKSVENVTKAQRRICLAKWRGPERAR